MGPRLILIALLVFSLGARGEVEKFARPCEEGICLQWWPKLPALKGWHHDEDGSAYFGVNALAPDGSTFRDSAAVIYAKALFKPRVPEHTSVSDLIEDDIKDFAQNVPGTRMNEAGSLMTGNNRKFQSVEFIPEGTGNWERVSYGEEGEFFLVFTVSARNKEALADAMPHYESLIRAYREAL